MLFLFFKDNVNMAIPLVNSIASWYLKKRFHQIELFLKYPNDVQNELLLGLIDTAKDTQNKVRRLNLLLFSCIKEDGGNHGSS